MEQHIAQIDIPRPILYAGDTDTDLFTLSPTKGQYPLSALEEQHAKAPYTEICIALADLPQAPEKSLSPEAQSALNTGLCFAERHELPVYFRLPSECSPASLQATLAELQAENDRLFAFKEAYEVMENSTSWKLTKPLRALSTALKRVLKAIPGAKKLAKALRYCKQNGIRATWHRILRQSDETRLAKKPLYTKAELAAQSERKFDRDIKFSILVPLYNTPLPFLREMIASVTAQTYRHWELCLADGSDENHAEVGAEVARLAADEPRILYRKLERNGGISENTNACIEMSHGDYIALFDHDDILHPAALYNMMEAICEQDADLVYTDEAIFQSPKLKKIIRVNYKPDYAPDTLRSVNYICHFTSFARSLLNEVGGFRPAFDGSQDHDLMLRLCERAAHIVHIPRVLYYWRAHAQSVAGNTSAKTYASDAGKRAVLAAMERCGQSGEVESSRALASMYRVRYDLVGTPLVSIIIPNKNHLDDLRLCLASILERSTYPSYEIVIVDNGSDDAALFAYYDELRRDPRFHICSLDIPFNYSMLNNYAVRQASGEYYLLLNNDIEITTPAWIEEMLMYVQRQDVAAAGAMLYYPDGTVQHAGVILGIGGVAGHAFKQFPASEFGYMGRMCYAQNLSAVTAACMLVKASAYHEVGGLDEGFQVAFNDVDFCLKLRAAGYLIVWTPFAEATHYESKSRGYEDSPQKQKRFNSEITRFMRKWSDTLAKGDPYYNPNLTLTHEDFSVKEK